MASNKELASEAAGLADQLGIEASTEGLSNKELAGLVAALRAKQDEADTEPRTPTRPKGTYVADGKAVTSKVGVLEGGRLVEDKYFSGGQKVVEDLVKRGVCVKVGG